MLTAVVWGASEPRSLALTLATLVPAAIDGALREVAVAGAGASGEARFVADQAGCRILGDGELVQVATGCKGRWLLLVRSGDRLPDDWLEAALRHDANGTQAARIAVGSPAAAWRRWWMRAGSALLLTREQVGQARAADWAELSRTIRARTLRTERAPHR